MRRVATVCILPSLALLACARHPDPAEAILAPGSRELVELGKGNRQFAFDLYRQLAKERDRPANLFFSPPNVQSVLVMAAAGARGETRAQMTRTLRLGSLSDQVHRAFLSLLKATEGAATSAPNDGLVMNAANALWSQRGYPFRPEFTRLAKRFYLAGGEEVDFASDPERARGTINNWVKARTGDRIEELIRKGVLSTTTRLVLTSAIYFHGLWQTPFPGDMTSDQQFQLEGGAAVKVPFMSRSERFAYAEDEDAQLLVLPYRGGRLSMLLVLPKPGRGRAALEQRLDAEWLRRRSEKLAPREIEVHLPKFSLRARVALGPVLESMGMSIPLSEHADFSGISATSAQHLSLSAVIHEAFVTVDERGTEAAAATGAGAVAVSAPATMFRADRPFIFLIQDRLTDTILFLGRVMNPKADSA